MSKHQISDLKLVELTNIDIIDYRCAEQINGDFKCQPLPFSSACDRTFDIIWEMSFRFNKSMPSWQGMIHLLHKECEHPGKSSVQFLQMIDINLGGGDLYTVHPRLPMQTCTKNKPISTTTTFEQPLFWKASEIVNAVLDDSPIRYVVLLLNFELPCLHEFVGSNRNFDGPDWT